MRNGFLLCLGVVACGPRTPDLAFPGEPSKYACVLSGGGGRGFAHVGVLKVLSEKGIRCQRVVGTSIGALVGALYASDPDPDSLWRRVSALEYEDVIDIEWSMDILNKGLVRGEAIERFVRNAVDADDIEDLSIPFVAIAADLDSGELVVLDTGPVASAVHASLAIPGIFQPVLLDGRRLVDGGVVANLAVDVARSGGAERILAVDITEGIAKKPPEDVLGITVRALDILMASQTARQAERADVVIRPDVADISVLDFTQQRRAFQAGVDAATANRAWTLAN